MKSILTRLILIYISFVFSFIFLVYVLFIKKNLILIEEFYILLLFIFFITIFMIILLVRTNNYIVLPLRSIIQNFKKFPNLNLKDQSLIKESKIIEIIELDNYVLDFFIKFSKYLEELNLEKSLLNSLLNNLKEGVICLDENKRILYINQFVKENFCRKDIPNVINKNYYEIITCSPLLDIIFKNYYNNKNFNYFFAGNKINEMTYEFKEKDKYYQIRFYPISLDHSFFESLSQEKNVGDFKENQLVLYLINDITEEYNVNRLREDFLQNASHELKTPITSIRGYAETLVYQLKEKKNFPEEHLLQFLEGILRNTERMESLIYDMVMISSLESKNYPFFPKNVNLNHFFNELILLVDGLLKPKNIKLELFIDANLPEIYADPLLLEHLFINLISNAIRYSFPDQKIEIHAFLLNHSRVQIEVKDYGVGIPEGFQEKIFERFFRIDKDRSRKEGGTGLGLSIVKQIVKFHNGRIYVKRNENSSGSTFVVILPIK